MTFTKDILHLSSLAAKSYKQVLFGHLGKEMHIFGASHVMLVNERGLGDSFMIPSSQSHLSDLLRNGALMPLGLCLGLQEEKNTSLWASTT